MKFNPRLKQEVAKCKEHVIIVEGKKDVRALEQLGFKKIHAIHKTGVPMREMVLEIMSEVDKKDKICILTDFDKKGKKIYLLLKSLFQEQGAKLDSSLRAILIKAGVSHIEGFDKFLKKVGRIG